MTTIFHTSVLLTLLSSACIASGGGSFGTTGPGPRPVAGAPESSAEGAYGAPAEGAYGAPAEGSYGGPAEPVPGGAPAARSSGPIEPRWDAFAFAVRERQGTYNGPWTITKLTTFKVGRTCYAKLGDKDSDSLNNTGWYVRNVLALAKTWTGDDWDAIENQRSNRAKDRVLVEPMMDEFGKRFHLTIAVEGEDCEVDRGALWIRYWYTLSEAFANYPPTAGKLFVTLNVTAAARDMTVDVDDSGTQFVVTAPRDIEARDWQDKLSKPFRRQAGKL
ncbi:MAG: hypothetical protein IPQ07_32765 [Myxococcales bacterium]|nr:hypothetical protein [Myxococcales bacterium]